MRLLRSALISVAAAATYGVASTRAYRLRPIFVPVGPSVPQATILHLSDVHLTARRQRLIRWLRALPDALGEVPDLVLATGDLIEENAAIEPLVELFGSLEARWGRFYVLGSHDYFQASLGGFMRSAATRWTGTKAPTATVRADTARLEEGLGSKGWVGLSNRSEVLDTPVGKIRVSGVDDPFMRRHQTGHIRRSWDEGLAVGLVHTPDVVSQWMLAGFDLVVAGHTHAGQVRIPGIGALVTNCTLPAELAGGLHRIGSSWLHVSPGLGTGKFSQVRFLAPPEATLLRLVAARA